MLRSMIRRHRFTIARHRSIIRRYRLTIARHRSIIRRYRLTIRTINVDVAMPRVMGVRPRSMRATLRIIVRRHGLMRAHPSGRGARPKL
jgi:hypothetical protein